MTKREDVIKAWECCKPFKRECKKCPYDKDCYHDRFSRLAIKDAILLIEDQLGETQEVVRCKDCRHHEYKDEIWYDQGPFHIIGGNQVHVCHFWGGKEGCVTNPEGWCYKGEKA